ncbi:hypothetical protein [Leptospira sp. GIMC2001]|uniref:hypothetical protein n=1 Tax=Leptospira sp. GIMC2001 TaxID=1513297 RepID=UPI00234A14FA|nr:hypothetical protein [Leptospira sp. GIMC2001]WCL48776.1 hypothetical protein O4O04_15920 [Leptospira sp. GIMC2001]
MLRFFFLVFLLFAWASYSHAQGKTQSIEMSLDIFEKSVTMKHAESRKSLLNWINQSIIFQSSPCRMWERDRIRSVSYYSLQCGGQAFDGFIGFGQKPNLNIRSFKINSLQSIGNREYISISILDGKHWSDSNLREKPLTKVQNAPESNPNLHYFINVAARNSNNESLKPNLSIFFDSSCPLEYLGANHDFYWDNQIYHEFNITCVKESIVSLVKIKANKFGEVLVGDSYRQNIPVGTKFLASMRLNSWSGDRIQWEEERIYPYDKQ